MSKMNRIARRNFNSLIAATVSTPWLSPTASHAQDDAQKRGGTLRVSHVVEPPKLITIDNLVSGEISSKMFDGLLNYDLDFKPQPELATAWDVSSDGLTYRFVLRQGVKWHDGKPFTSADAAFSIQTMRERHPRNQQAFANISEIVTPDDHSLVLKLSKPAPYLLKAFVSSESPIFPKHIFQGSDPANHPARRQPIGTGPFIFKEWVAGSHILLERNAHYWKSGLPYLDRVIFRFLPDPGSRVAAFEAREIDLGGTSPVPVSDLPRLLEKTTFIDATTAGYAFHGYHTQAVLNLRNPVLKNKAVRQAIAHAINYDTFLQVAWYGKGKLSPTAISPQLKEFHNDKLKPYKFDFKLSEKLLDDAGFPRKNGIRFPLRIVYSPYLDNYRRAADFFVQSLKRIGIDAQLESSDYATFVKKVYTDGAFDISLEGMINLFDPTLGVQRIYWSKNIKPGVPFSNASYYSNSEVDALLEQAAAEPDATKRRAQFLRFQEIVYEDVPVINLVANDLFTVFNKKVKDHTVSVNGIFGNLAQAYIEK